MLEATPGKPWGIGFKDLLDVEPNMKWRYMTLFRRRLGACSHFPQTSHSQGSHGTDGISGYIDDIPSSWIS